MPIIFTISSNLISLSFKIFSEIILLAKSLLLEYAASWAKQALFNPFLYKCFKLLIFLSFWMLSQCLVNDQQAL